jgi:hypothetical protein
MANPSAVRRRANARIIDLANRGEYDEGTLFMASGYLSLERWEERCG